MLLEYDGGERLGEEVSNVVSGGYSVEGSHTQKCRLLVDRSLDDVVVFGFSMLNILHGTVDLAFVVGVDDDGSVNAVIQISQGIRSPATR